MASSTVQTAQDVGLPVGIDAGALLTFIVVIKSDVGFIPLFFSAFIRFLTQIVHVIPLFFFYSGVLMALCTVARFNHQFVGFNMNSCAQCQYAKQQSSEQVDSFAESDFRSSFPV